MTSDSHFRRVKVRGVGVSLRSLPVCLFFSGETLLQSAKARTLAGWLIDRSCKVTPNAFPTSSNSKVIGGGFSACICEGFCHFESRDQGNFANISKPHLSAQNSASVSASSKQHLQVNELSMQGGME
jgi:hypothetical protein